MIGSLGSKDLFFRRKLSLFTIYKLTSAGRLLDSRQEGPKKWHVRNHKTTSTQTPKAWLKTSIEPDSIASGGGWREYPPPGATRPPEELI